MAKKKKAINPFYVLVVIAGVAFGLTACAYGVMAVRMLHRATAAETASSSQESVEIIDNDGSMMDFLDRHGATLLLAEVAALAVFTVAAMATDSFWNLPAEPNGDD